VSRAAHLVGRIDEYSSCDVTFPASQLWRSARAVWGGALFFVVSGAVLASSVGFSLKLSQLASPATFPEIPLNLEETSQLIRGDSKVYQHEIQALIRRV
jgi:hypothetical protein